MFDLLLFVYVMILDKIYLWKISIEADIDEKIYYVVRLLDSWAGQGISDPTLFGTPRLFYAIAIFPKLFRDSCTDWT